MSIRINKSPSGLGMLRLFSFSFWEINQGERLHGTLFVPSALKLWAAL